MVDVATAVGARRVGSAERFAHRAMAIVDKALRATAHGNERGVAIARLIIAVAFIVRLVLLMGDEIVALDLRVWITFVGMLIAVPVAASLGVLTRFALEQYRASLLYQGHAGLPAQDASFTSAVQPALPHRRRKPAARPANRQDPGA